jgi:hypothetical protein
LRPSTGAGEEHFEIKNNKKCDLECHGQVDNFNERLFLTFDGFEALNFFVLCVAKISFIFILFTMMILFLNIYISINVL